MNRPSPSLNVALAMPADIATKLFPPQLLDTLAEEVNVLSRQPLEDFTSAGSRAILAQADILITGWGCPLIDADVLAVAPRLRYILHAAGTVKHHLTPACWERGIEVSTAADANAIPVAEYTLAMILLANKKVLQLGRMLHARRSTVDPDHEFPALGNYRKRVGIIGASKIGRHVIRLLKPFEVEVVVADPFLDEAEATVLGVTSVTLEELASTCDVVSLHAPSLPSTRNLISQDIIASFRPGTTFINTARGELVDQDALLARLEVGDLFAVLDVTTPWELPSDSGFYSNPHVLLTPHLAGSLGTEVERLAATAVQEAHRVARGEPLRFSLPADQLDFTA